MTNRYSQLFALLYYVETAKGLHTILQVQSLTFNWRTLISLADSAVFSKKKFNKFSYTNALGPHKFYILYKVIKLLLLLFASRYISIPFLSRYISIPLCSM